MIRVVTIGVLLGFAVQACAAEPYSGVTQVGTNQHFANKESSGLVVSRRYPGVLWTHNDGPVFGTQWLFAMNQNGKSIGAFEVQARLIDWEDLGIDNAGNLYLADIGGDGMFRTHVAVYRVKEPNPYKRSGLAQITRRWYLKFPEGRITDCEAFFVHGNFGYLITKRPVFPGVVKMYRFSLLDTRKSIPLQLVTQIGIDSPVTSASLSPDNQRLGLTSSDGVYIYFINGKPATAGTAPSVFFEWHNDFMEGGTFFRDGFLTSAEQRGQIWFFSNAVFRCQEPVRITTRPKDQTISNGKPAPFEAKTVGCPLAQYQWYFNGTLIPGATSASLLLPSVSPADAGRYDVVAYNRYGSDTNGATLTVRLKPDIRITEVSSSQATDATGKADWWEIANFEDVAVDLSGWRFNDSIGGLIDPGVIPDGTIIQPGEVIVLVENLAYEEFTTWWGPIFAQIITYTGSGLSFKATSDDLYLWDSVSTDPADVVDHVHFGDADPGVTFIYNPDTEKFGTKSEVGFYGAFKAVTSSDVGSPGVISGPVPPP